MIEIQKQNETNGRWETIKNFPTQTEFSHYFLWIFPVYKTIKSIEDCCIEAVEEAKQMKDRVIVIDETSDGEGGEMYLVMWNGRWLHSVDDLC